MKKNVSVTIKLDWSIDLEDLELRPETWEEVERVGYLGIKRNEHKCFDEVLDAVISQIDLPDYVEEIEVDTEEYD